MEQLRVYRGLLGNRALGRLLAGETISAIGDWLYLVAILVVVWNVSEDPLLLGVVGVARIVPYAILSVPAGIVADRFDRRLILIVSDLLRAGLMVVLGWLVTSGADVLLVVATAVLASCVATFWGPAIGAYLPMVVADEEQLGPANSAWSTLDSLGFVIGPGVAGLLIAAGGLELAFFLNAGTFVLCAAILVGLPPGKPQAATTAPVEGARQPAAGPPEAQEASPTAAPEAVERLATAEQPAAGSAEQPAAGKIATDPAAPGWRAMVGLIRGPIVLDAASSLSGGAIAVVTVMIAVDVLHAGEAATGYLNAAIGVGGIFASLVAGILTLRRLTWPLLVASILGAITMGLLAFSGSLWVAALLLAMWSGALLIIDVINTTLVQRLASDATRGRAMGVLQSVGTLFFAAGSFLGPVVADVAGMGVALGAASVALLVLAIVAVTSMSKAGALEAPAVDAVRRRLLTAPVFAGLPPNRLEAIARQLRSREVAAGEVVITEGERADRFYLVESGTYVVTSGSGDELVTLRTLGADDVFGERGLLGEGIRTATVTASKGGRLWSLDADAFRELVQAGPGLGSRLMDLYRGSAGMPVPASSDRVAPPDAA
jgi:MFS family permease